MKHLEFIQAVIARQASHSFAVKGWTLTVAGIIYAYAAANLSWWLALIACLPGLAFAWLDLYYLRQERLFRHLYDDAMASETTVPVFSMNTRPYLDGGKHPRCSYGNVCRSPSWWLLHALVILVGLILLGVAAFKPPGA